MLTPDKRIEEIAAWHLANYPKPGPVTRKDGSIVDHSRDVAVALATDLLYPRQATRDGAVAVLEGKVNESAFLAHLQFLYRPESVGVLPQYSFEPSTDAQDEQGVDIVVFERAQDGYIPIGGFDVTLSRRRRGQKHQDVIKRSRAAGFPIFALWANELGADELLDTVRQGQYPTVGDFIGERLVTRRGDAGLLQIVPQVRQVLDANFYGKYPLFTAFLQHFASVAEGHVGRLTA